MWTIHLLTALYVDLKACKVGILQTSFICSRLFMTISIAVHKGSTCIMCVYPGSLGKVTSSQYNSLYSVVSLKDLAQQDT